MQRFSWFFIIVLLCLSGLGHIYAQCEPFFPTALSNRPASYEIKVNHNDSQKTIEATQTVRFVNQSPQAIQELQFYLYLNAFKNTESTFLRGTYRIFGQTYNNRSAGEWGWIEVEKIERVNQAGTVDLSSGMHNVQPDDGNLADQTVLSVPLEKPLMPGETAVLHLKWRAKMPKTIARAGYSKDFYLFCHWFPQLGVYEQNIGGEWGWNCHQFFRNTEFFADFGVYDVYVTTNKRFVMGATGCMVAETSNADETITRHYHAEDVIDFAWSIYPRFEVLTERWQGVEIRLLYPPEHTGLAARYIKALKFALAYMDQHVGKYPYPSITVVDPPFHGLRSGLMEYPTLVTVGTFYGMPENIRITESLVVHEFVHQYFMGMLASNEKEEPWLDEGFVTYFEDRIIDAAYGTKHALVDVAGYQFDNRELTRLEYTSMRNPREGITARPGWLFTESEFKPLIYSKTATTLRTLQALVGTARMDQIIQVYFEKWKFRHPSGQDFMAVLKSELLRDFDPEWALQVYGLFETGIYKAAVLDYAVTHITNEQVLAPQGWFGTNSGGFKYKDGKDTDGRILSKVELQRKGEWVFPVELLVRFEDGSAQTLHWDGEEGSKIFEFTREARVVSAQIDPEQKLSLDIDLNNNSMTLQPDTTPLWKYASKAVFWVQNIFQTIGFLV